jgi:hypothetical protein
MTNGEFRTLERWKDQVASQLTTLSGQIEDMKRDMGHMVTRQEYNEAHAPLIRMVEDHERVYRWGLRNRNRLAWIGFSVIVGSIWAAPHAGKIGSWIEQLISFAGK